MSNKVRRRIRDVNTCSLRLPRTKTFLRGFTPLEKDFLTGFTLIEVLIALLILGIGMSFLYTAFPLGIRISKEIQILGKVSFFAQKKIEELKTTNETLANSTGQETDFNWTLKIQDYNTEDNIALKKIQLDAEWLEAQTARKKSFVTYFKY